MREFVRLKSNRPHDNVDGRSMLIAGGIDFDSKNGEPNRTFSPLPGSAQEVGDIRDIALKEGLDTNLLQGREATKETLLHQLPQADYVHLATHGFFGDAMPVMDTSDLFADFGGLREPWMELIGRTRNPLAESGLALAGANQPPSVTEGATGLLTAEELIGGDLSHARLVTLSACETGRGEENTGQGVLGLRSAFLAAGARGLLMSIWKVPDDATRMLMKQFYANLWQRKLPPLEALVDAQRALRNSPSEELASPVSWAGWVFVGEGW
jgi:CHAT domain-containing protein